MPDAYVLERDEEHEELDRKLAAIPGPYYEYLRRVGDEGYEADDERNDDASQSTSHRHRQVKQDVRWRGRDADENATLARLGFSSLAHDLVLSPALRQQYLDPALEDLHPSKTTTTPNGCKSTCAWSEERCLQMSWVSAI